MPVSAETLALLMEKGLVGDDLLQVVRAIDADGAHAQPIRTARQDRNARYYRNRKIREASESVLINTSEQDEKGVAASPKEINQTPTTTPKTDDRAGDAKSILGSVLADETVVDLLAHRKAIRSPITPGAAKGLIKAFVDFGDPERAARAMMANGWRGFKPEWMADRQARAGPRSNGHRTVADMAAMNLDHDPDIFDAAGSSASPDARYGAAESAGSADQGKRGFAGRLSLEDANAARRGALVDH